MPLCSSWILMDVRNKYNASIKVIWFDSIHALIFFKMGKPPRRKFAKRISLRVSRSLGHRRIESSSSLRHQSTSSLEQFDVEEIKRRSRSFINPSSGLLSQKTRRLSRKRLVDEIETPIGTKNNENNCAKELSPQFGEIKVAGGSGNDDAKRQLLLTIQEQLPDERTECSSSSGGGDEDVVVSTTPSSIRQNANHQTFRRFFCGCF